MFNWFTNLFKAKVHQPLPVGHTIEVPYIRCVAQQIINDLDDIANVDKWKLEHKEYFYECSCEGKNYTLHWDGGYVSLEEVSFFSFNKDESKEICKRFEAINDAKWDKIRQIQRKEEEETLKRLFPSCYQ